MFLKKFEAQGPLGHPCQKNYLKSKFLRQKVPDHQIIAEYRCPKEVLHDCMEPRPLDTMDSGGDVLLQLVEPIFQRLGKFLK